MHQEKQGHSMWGVQMKGLVERNGGGHEIRKGFQSAVLSDSKKCKVARNVRITVQPSVNEVVVPNMLPGFIVIVLESAIVKRNYFTDTLDKLEAGFCTVIN